MRAHRGFTLIELMITVAVVAILAAIAYPSYTDYVIRGRLAEATSALQEQRVRLEQFFLDNRTYVGGCATLPTLATFTLTCPTLTATTYTVQAAGSAAQTTGFTYTINQANTRATTASPTGWGTSTTCWVIRKGGGC